MDPRRSPSGFMMTFPREVLKIYVLSTLGGHFLIIKTITRTFVPIKLFFLISRTNMTSMVVVIRSTVGV
ncbi:hypothetical protein NY2A_b232R [Paramecium bursaria Chlorella virus NY2A]|uniref:Uncharacterized protein b232R n=1 Tax=Paramecium bursaria Chlorella virus NY2A TaxID=46021 RepID=A7IWA7_PBCVN|nr:hypothetical protein NY2A_b232R [Paramecium bursaria Chlorella virus NY2A]ABT14631.1 hypothetical protein NY2A_b232R [Paramecium bursaria Chlorella virus NY2A]